MPRGVVGLPIDVSTLDPAITPLASTDQLVVVQNATPRLVDAGDVSLTTAGATTDRPTGLTAANAGRYYYDTTLSKPIWWNGSAWRDAAGSAV